MNRDSRLGAVEQKSLESYSRSVKESFLSEHRWCPFLMGPQNRTVELVGCSAWGMEIGEREVWPIFHQRSKILMGCRREELGMVHYRPQIMILGSGLNVGFPGVLVFGSPKHSSENEFVLNAA